MTTLIESNDLSGGSDHLRNFHHHSKPVQSYDTDFVTPSCDSLNIRVGHVQLDTQYPGAQFSAQNFTSSVTQTIGVLTPEK